MVSLGLPQFYPQSFLWAKKAPSINEGALYDKPGFWVTRLEVLRG